MIKTAQPSVRKLLLASLLLFGSVCSRPAEAANTRQFSAIELGLAFLDPKGLTDSGDQMLDNLFGTSNTLMSSMPSSARQLASPLGEAITKVKDQIMGAAKGKSNELDPYLKPYQIYGQSPLSYQELDLPGKPALRSLVERSNDLLKQSSRVSGTIRITDELLPKLETSLDKLDPGDAMQKAALGIVAVSLANLNLGAAQSVDRLRQDIGVLQGQVQSEFQHTQAAVSANPMNALSMGEEVQVLSGLTETLPHASKDLADASGKLPGLISRLQALISRLRR